MVVMDNVTEEVSRALFQRVGITYQEHIFLRGSLIGFKLGSGQTSYCCPGEILLAGCEDFQGRYFYFYSRGWKSQLVCCEEGVRARGEVFSSEKTAA